MGFDPATLGYGARFWEISVAFFGFRKILCGNAVDTTSSPVPQTEDLGRTACRSAGARRPVTGRPLVHFLALFLGRTDATPLPRSDRPTIRYPSSSVGFRHWTNAAPIQSTILFNNIVHQISKQPFYPRATPSCL